MTLQSGAEEDFSVAVCTTSCTFSTAVLAGVDRLVILITDVGAFLRIRLNL